MHRYRVYPYAFLLRLNMFPIINKHYLNVEDYHQAKKAKTNDKELNIMYLNAQSCANLQTFDEIKLFLSEHPVHIHALVISETWFKQNQCNLYEIDSYQSYHSCRKFSKGAGLSIYISKLFKVEDVAIFSNEFNYISVQIGMSNCDKIKIIGFYRPPRSCNMKKFSSVCDSLLVNDNIKCVFVGDLNLNLNSMSLSYNAKEYLNKLLSNGYELCNSLPTRKISNTLIDHVFFNAVREISITIDTIECDYSDHNIIMSKLLLHTPNPQLTIEMKIIDYDYADELVQTQLNNLETTGMCANKLYDAISSIIKDSVQRATKTMSYNQKKFKSCEWLVKCPKLMILLRKKNSLLKREKKQIKENKCCDETTQKIKCISDRIIKIKAEAKRIYYGNLFSNANSTRDKWKTINKILSNNAKKECDIKINRLNPNNAVCDEFADYFAQIGVKLSNNIPTRPSDHPNKLNTIESQRKSIFLIPTSQTEVEQMIDGLNNNKAAGIDGIPVRVIKRCKHVIAPCLAELINLSFSTGVYPDALKVAKVTPIYKNGEKELVENYRPISVLPAINTIVEKILYSRMNSFLMNCKFFYANQFGFRQNCSTKIAIAETIELINQNMESNRTTTALFMDLSKAFDCVNHEILLYKLERAGIRGVPLELLTSYLSNRKMIVWTNNQQSRSHNVTLSVPQGSCLGPLLYLIYINDFGKLEIAGNSKLFADDTTLFYDNANIATNIEKLSNDLDRIAEYFRLNKLTLNLGKTKIMHFNRKNGPTANTQTVNYNGNLIQQTQQITYLGIILDRRLDWNAHIDNLCKKLSATTGVMSKLNKFVPLSILKTIYFAIIHSRIDYGAFAWTMANKTLVNRVQVHQNRALKTIHSLNNRYHTLDLYTRINKNVIPVKALGEHQLRLLTAGIMTGVIYSNLRFEKKRSGRNMRRIDTIITPLSRTNQGLNRISVAGANAFNGLNDNLRACTEYHSFKKELKIFTLDIENLLQLLA